MHLNRGEDIFRRINLESKAFFCCLSQVICVWTNQCLCVQMFSFLFANTKGSVEPSEVVRPLPKHDPRSMRYQGIKLGLCISGNQPFCIQMGKECVPTFPQTFHGAVSTEGSIQLTSYGNNCCGYFCPTKIQNNFTFFAMLCIRPTDGGPLQNELCFSRAHATIFQHISFKSGGSFFSKMQNAVNITQLHFSWQHKAQEQRWRCMGQKCFV